MWLGQRPAAVGLLRNAGVETSRKDLEGTFPSLSLDPGWGEYSHSPFTDEETESQKVSAACPRSPLQELKAGGSYESYVVLWWGREKKPRNRQKKEVFNMVTESEHLGKRSF